MAAAGQDAYCTLLMSNEYLPGAAVLARSLRDAGTKKQLAVLITPDALQPSTIEVLRNLYDQVIPVSRIINQTPANLYLMNRPNLSSTFTKIALWRQTQFQRIVYLDADVVALRAPDELFDLDTNFAAVPDIGWPDCFNSGVLVLKPNMGDYYALLALAQRGISFDGADQGLFNMHFRDWQRMSFAYNCTPSGHYEYVPAYRHFQSTINMLHFIGHDKPWFTGREAKGSGGVYEEMLGRWWSVYDRHYRAPMSAYSSGQTHQGERRVRQYVKGEATSSKTVKPPRTEETLPDKTAQDFEATPRPTVEQQPFSAPQMQWDAMYQPPPHNARPEASNFPTQTYTMSEDHTLFQAPKYPEPPKDMWYEVPKTSPTYERPKPIFPWEENQAKANRVFPDDEPLSPPQRMLSPSWTTDDDTQAETSSPPTPTSLVVPAEPFSAFTRTNAWDEIPEIERYIFNNLQRRHSKIHVLSNSALNPGAKDASLDLQDADSVPQRRRPSMRLTDFPTEIERPSLPVTPAPVRRSSNFWGEERDAEGNLPAAEGVPKQEDWDPVAKLEELQRRQSDVLSRPEPMSPARNIPLRKLPGVVTPTLSDEDQTPLRPSTEFAELDFGARIVEKSGEDEGVFSPTES
ncbi:Nucleotide-diphospho-sugar transferases [Lasallia pustulata]|uniref:glycogenin glucosyltransferase n=1 Tax=Lasallia pustulata TaxID=136370 RepID=A0A1W5D9Y4_9LECA|nr:Nucleotide-diphospho-sugar transferases [Lasallia pustulata]